MSDLSPRSSLKINATNHIATPIPPVLQQRMAAFANRTGAPPPTAADFNTKRTFDQAGDALRRADLASHPVLHPTHSFPRPKPASLAAKRMRPDLNLAAIDPKLVADDASTSFAGLGLGRPLDSLPKRSAVDLGTPFSNFSKIVYVVWSMTTAHHSLTSYRKAMLQVHSTLKEKPSCMLQGSTFQMEYLSQSLWMISFSTRN